MGWLGLRVKFLTVPHRTGRFIQCVSSCEQRPVQGPRGNPPHPLLLRAAKKAAKAEASWRAIDAMRKKAQAEVASEWTSNEQEFRSKIRDGILAEEAAKQAVAASSSAGPARGARSAKRGGSGLGDGNSPKKRKTEDAFSRERADIVENGDGAAVDDDEDGDAPPSQRSVDMEDLKAVCLPGRQSSGRCADAKRRRERETRGVTAAPSPRSASAR